MKYKVLVVDDEPLNLKSTSMCLENWGYDVEVADSGNRAIQKVKDSRDGYAVVLMDFRMPNKNGAQTASEIRKINDEAIIVMYSGDASRVATLDSFKIGKVADFIDKGADLEVLREGMENACRKYEETTRYLKPHIPQSQTERHLASIGLVGVSPAMLSLMPKIDSYRNSDRPVMILGETGTGKESVARALHAGPSDKFYVVNCAAFTNSSLLESELCGYEKGAFTGANQRKTGILELANGGTVFFDELHRLELDAQAKLLRVLQEKKIRRVGSPQETAVNFRAISAAQPQIAEYVKAKEILPDLYYRLNFLQLEIPSLRERLEDIAPLVSHFCEKYNLENKTKKQFLMSTLRVMERYSWPGNVRELDGIVYKTLKNSTKSKIGPENLDSKLFGSKTTMSSTSSFEEFKKQQEIELRKYLLSQLKNSRSIAHAAERIDVSPTTLRSILQRLKVKMPSEKHGV